eukprot:m.148341 g.148341  ORF g.148341 m.148341 type:complete len:289 (-) comp16131_c4_seq1:138-1004(-)
MDIVLNVLDEHVLTPYVFPSWIAEDNPYRQLLVLWAVAGLGGGLLYVSTAALGWFFLFDKQLRRHPKFIENQEIKEITASLKAVPGMAFLTAVFFLAEVRGYSKLYDDPAAYGGVPFLVVSFVCFLLFTDMMIYWIHRGLHHPAIYPLHKPHHLWKVPTPFASHAFHPLDGFAQSLPYHIYPFLFPLHKGMYLMLFIFVNLWSVGIHDNDYRLPTWLQPIVNGAAHHTDHHLKFNYNYGQYFTLWDRIGGSYLHPGAFQGDGPHDQVKKHLQEKPASANGSVSNKKNN